MRPAVFSHDRLLMAWVRQLIRGCQCTTTTAAAAVAAKSITGLPTAGVADRLSTQLPTAGPAAAAAAAQEASRGPVDVPAAALQGLEAPKQQPTLMGPVATVSKVSRCNVVMGVHRGSRWQTCAPVGVILPAGSLVSRAGACDHGAV